MYKEIGIFSVHGVEGNYEPCMWRYVNISAYWHMKKLGRWHVSRLGRSQPK